MAARERSRVYTARFFRKSGAFRHYYYGLLLRLASLLKAIL